jgi:NifU-like protein involved in Fe-S cluster formation
MDDERDIIEGLREEGYSEKVIEYWLHPKNFGISNSTHCDGYSGWNDCPFGDSMAICLIIKKNMIIRATFMSDICIGSISAASLLTEKVKNLTLAKAAKISSEEIIEDLGGLPEQFIHCADLAQDTLKKAINNYVKSLYKEEPWKKLYKKS